MLTRIVRLLPVVLLAAACAKKNGPRSLLVVEITKAGDVPALDRLVLEAGSASKSEAGDAPQKLGVYLPPTFSGQVTASVKGYQGKVVVASGTASTDISPGETKTVAVVLQLLAGDGGMDDRMEGGSPEQSDGDDGVDVAEPTDVSAETDVPEAPLDMPTDDVPAEADVPEAPPDMPTVDVPAEDAPEPPVDMPPVDMPPDVPAGALGAPCATPIECASGYCVDGVCCGAVTCGACETCNGSAPGTCAPVGTGAGDPDTCPAGKCYAGTCCVGCWNGSACVAGTADPACGAAGAVCAACGECRDCVSGACLTVANAEDPDTCNGTNICDDSGACKKKGGTACTMGSECPSGFCTDGVCCDVASCGPCQRCDGATAGTCTMVGNGSLDADSCASGRCYGGACCAGCWNGSACVGGGTDAECGGGGGTCAACLTCQGCTAGACTAVMSADDPGSCSGTMTCDAMGVCKKALGQTCAVTGDCATGTCVDSVCCSASSCGACQTCNGTSAGTCMPQTDGASCASGKCYGGACCTTCWNGSSCVAGNVDSACGTAGAACATCGTCKSCSGGSCATVTNADDPDNCTGTKSCNSMGLCKDKNGQPCGTDGTTCVTANCVDTVCCASTSCGTCQTCNGGVPGTCGFVAAGVSDPGTCTSPSTCNGSGTCSGGADMSTIDTDTASSGDGYQGVSLAIDSAGKSHIAYFDNDPTYDIKYATNASGAWVTSTIDSAGYVGWYPSLRIGSDGKVHVAYLDCGTSGCPGAVGPSSFVKYGVKSGATWSIEPATAAGHGGMLSLVLDAANKAHISHFNSDPAIEHLWYATNSTGTWTDTEIDGGSTNVGSNNSIGIDSGGKLHVAYWDWDGGRTLKYNTNASGSWVPAVLETADDPGHKVRLAVDGAGKIHICHIDANADLRYTTNATGSWVGTALDTAGSLGGDFNSITVDLAGHIHISYYDLTNADLKYATNKSGAWQTFTVDAVGDVGGSSGIAVDSTGKVHVAYTDATAKTLKYMILGAGYSCIGLLATCGPTASESCCAAPLVPGGTYNRSNDPVYPATVSDFRLDKFEITVGRFRKFLEAGKGTAASPPAAGSGANPNAPGTGWDTAWNSSLPASTAALQAALKCYPTYQTWTDSPGGNESRPQNCITWYDAFAFCIWDGGRLPSEAEWNYAAAGGSEQRDYPWGAAAPDGTRANYNCNEGCSSPAGFIFVGTKPAGDGRWGHADLAGNVMEWNFDWYATYINPCTNCAAATVATYRVLRGGAWADVASGLVSSRRDLSSFPTDRGGNIGARCARSAP